MCPAWVILPLAYINIIIFLQVTEEVNKLLELKKQLTDDSSKKFVLKTPKV
jgi:hypothetical protein